ncbi:hypothetical protein Csp2054_14275 [Curtobacterium sp. 'Ferrero']|uniref:hypothetical protein n=1 Tax=Curtobacterium sp. 'Ferrero' TaxID=2033654 RepID=UPI000BD7E0B0|nr:hypothetical protein [Curtobacterium sp. 'Ferrero']PCN47005.1 hypothetical protein Csp2054_14275 [Curtobacterium sp. 'Ferrero']
MTDTIHILGEGGGVFELSLPLHETIADKLKKGIVRRVNADGSPFDEHARPTGVEPADTRPTVRASKDDWVAWSVAESERRGTPITIDDAQALTKDQLIEAYGTAQEPTDPEHGKHEADETDEQRAEREAAEKAAAEQQNQQ